MMFEKPEMAPAYGKVVWGILFGTSDVYPAATTYTPLFAVARVAGWPAHGIEELIGNGNIIKPAPVYMGPNNVPYIPMKERQWMS